MADSLVSDVSEPLVVQSHRGPYTVHFDEPVASDPAKLLTDDAHFIVDATVARLYATPLAAILDHPRTIVIEATEANKSIDRTIPVFERLVANRIRRDQVIVAIGGGIIQDISCFAASVLLRGVRWRLVPTTLLAQADSCIGSKSSINLSTAKNILGTFHPPTDVYVDVRFLDTLEDKDVRSGIGEIIKVHAIAGAAAFDGLAKDYDGLFRDRAVLLRYMRAALDVKRRYIEEDEFDRGVRNVFNYGHSFGHAIESATGYGIPHGIAVALGMDMANFVAVRRDMLPAGQFDRMHPVLERTYAPYKTHSIPAEPMLQALMKDKKNTSTALGLILPIGNEAHVQRTLVPPDDAFRSQCKTFLASLAT
jgi:3-dehydroquinate synthase